MYTKDLNLIIKDEIYYNKNLLLYIKFLITLSSKILSTFTM